MSEIKHTPGPWKLVAREVLEDGTAFPAHVVGGPREVIVCHLESNVTAQFAVDEPGSVWDKDRANTPDARLIAAAPELLEALIAVVSVADRATVEFDKARAAISKATGEIK